MADIGGRVEENVSLAERTSSGIGGVVERLVYAQTSRQAAQWLATGEVVGVIGGGTNLLVSDEGVDGTLLAIGNDRVSASVGGDGVIVRVGAGMGATRLAGWLMRHGYAGFEFGYGLPGTVGGAVRMNAGTTQGEMKDVVADVTVASSGGTVATMPAPALGFVYRGSSLPDGVAVTEVTMRLTFDRPDAIRARMRAGYEERKARQPLDLPSAGSVFKNPPGDYAGRLIEAAGLKGERIGAAMVSPKHANFIVNTGGAVATDVYRLVRRIERRVAETFGVALEREIRLLGRFDHVD
jgi:UDP-N-acetylmuramate dehydrogenase